MKKQSLNLRRVFVALLMMAICVPFGIDALAGAAPEITSFYPGKRDENPMELKHGMKAYVYFATGTKAVNAKATLVQDGKDLGIVVYTGPETGQGSLVLDPGNPDNSALNLIEPGEFTFNFCEISYLSDGELVTASGEVFASVTYKRAMDNGKIVSEINLRDKTMLSYYEPDADDGLVSFTFDKAIDPTRPTAFLVYGQGNQYIETRVDIKVSNDDKTVTVDLRGKCWNVDALAPGVVFVDETGKPIDPPTSVSLSIERLECVDGTQIASTSVSLDGQYSMELEGRIYHTYNYVDLTFPNPELVKAEFYSQASPAVRYGTMQADSDMLDLYVDNSSYITKADVKISVNGASATVPFGQVTVGNDVYTVAIPEAIKAAGAAGMVISLENVEFNTFDGSKHVIVPMYFEGKTPEVNSLGELKVFSGETPVVVNLYDGMLVTLANDQGYMFAEDATAGVQIITEDYSQAFNQGDLVKGRLVGQYLNFGLLLIDKAASELTISAGNADKGLEMDDVFMAVSGEFDNRLLTFTASDNLPIEYDPDTEMIMIDGTLPVMTDFVGGVSLAEGMRVVSVTGVLYNDASLGQPMLLIRERGDIVDAPKTGIDGGATSVEAAGKVYDIKGVNHQGRDLAPGLYIIDGKKTLVK